MNDPLSGCCQAEVLEAEWDSTCSKCGTKQLFIFQWSHQSWDAPGVWEDFQGRKYFGNSATSTLKHYREAIEHHQTLVCVAKHVVDTIGLRHDTQDTDFLSEAAHRAFTREWAPKVVNPELGGRFFRP